MRDVAVLEADPVVALPITLVIEARSLDVPKDPEHPNRHYFSGVLTKVGVPSDAAPNGSGGKRVMLTRECAENALDSLLGMGIDLASDLKGHAPTSKIGIIDGATIDGEDLRITGFLYASDFPAETLKIVLQQADLGFSFEARNLSVESVDADPLVIKKCFFTGAAVLMKDAAAYHSTSLAAAAAKEQIMEEIPAAEAKVLVDDAVAEAVAKALEPITAALAGIAATQTAQTEAQAAQAAIIEELKKTPEVKAIEANAAMCARVEPHAAALETCAAAMEQEGIGVASPHGHVHHLHRMAAAMRADAAQGRLPSSYHESGSYYAEREKQNEQQQQATGEEDVDVKDAPEFKELKAAFEKQSETVAKQAEAMTKFQDMLASMETKSADLVAKVAAAAEPPQRKTVSPGTASLMLRHGIEGPEGDATTIPLSRIDASLAKGALTSEQRLAIKLQFQRDGLLANG